MEQRNVFILNLCLVFTILFVSSPIEVKGHKNVNYPTGGFYDKFLWQDFNPRKRIEAGVKSNESIFDGQVLFGDPDMGDTYKPIYFNNEPLIKDDDILFKTKKLSVNKMRTRNYAQAGYGIKVLPGTLIFWRSTL